MNAVLKEQDIDTRQFQLWEPVSHRYIPAPARLQTLDADRARRIAGRRGWRIAKAERLTKNPKLRAPTFTGSARTVEDVQRDYLRWAQAHGLKVITAGRKWRPNWLPNSAMRTPIFTGEIRYLSPEDQFRVTHEELPE
jgi:hypothetical protein